MTDYGVTNLGFKPKALTQVQTELNQALQAAFGDNINLAPTSVFGQLVAIMAERETSLWQLGQALYNSQNPAAASGLAVDNILALSGVQRLAAAPTITDPQPKLTGAGVNLYGLVLYGTPGTVIPQGALVSNGQASPLTLTLDSAVTIQPAINARQALTFSNQPDTGSYALTFTDASGDALTTPALAYGMPVADILLQPNTSAPAGATYQLLLTQGQSSLRTQALSAAASAGTIQQAIRNLAGYGNVTVTATANAGCAVHFPDTPVPAVASSDAGAPSISLSLQSIVNTLTLSDGATQPFTDCAVVALANGYQFDFGGGAAATGQTPSAGSAVPLIQVATSTLAAAGQVTNIVVAESRVGAPAQGVGSATATATGANTALAGAIQTIVTPQTGWTGVNNQLDCIAGRDEETDAAAIARNAALRASRGSGSLAAMVQRVQLVEGVTASLGFQNLTNAALQVLTFSSAPTQGSYALATATGSTAALAYSAAAGDVAAALQALPGYGTVRVTGSSAYGLVIDFNGAQGGQAQPLVTVASNSTGVALAVAFGRAPHAVEIVAQGGTDAAVAQAVLDSLPAGMASYGAPVVQTLATVAQGSTQLTLSSALGAEAGLAVNMASVPLGTTVASVSGSTVTMTAAALAAQTNAVCVLNHAVLLSDAAGNPQLVGFSRPEPVLVYVTIRLLTDRYVVAGNANSGLNPSSQWNPASVADIQAAVLAIGNSVGIGGLIVAQGSNGLLGSFNQIPGIVSYNLTFGTSPSPTQAANLQLQANQAPAFESANVSVSYT